MKTMVVTLGLFAALALSSCCHKQTVTISVGDPAAAAWQKLRSQGHQVARIPFDGRIQDLAPTPDGGSQSRLVGMIVPYDVNGRIVQFTHEYSKDTISGIMADNRSLNAFEVPEAAEAK